MTKRVAGKCEKSALIVLPATHYRAALEMNSRYDITYLRVGINVQLFFLVSLLPLH